MSPRSSSVASSSGLRIALGVVCLVLGIVALVWPDVTLVILAVILGLQLIIAGIAHVVLEEWTRAMSTPADRGGLAYCRR